MALTFVIHEATRTGAPRLGGLIARELAREEDVRVLVMKDGPLTPWLKQTLGAANVRVCRDDPFHFRNAFAERLALAQAMLEDEASDLVYANSIAASVFTLAGALIKRKTILHVHEKQADLVNLLAHDVTKVEVVRAATALVLAADELRGDVIDVFGAAPAEIESFGVAVDVEAVRHEAGRACEPARNARGRALAQSKRTLVGMCGHASARKGADIFLQTAVAAPECDFLWVGGWRPEETPDNAAYAAFAQHPPGNLYLAGVVDNPYPYLAMMDLFFLSSREDPNPLVLGEAVALGLPVLAFSRATAVTDRLGRFAMLCYGEPNAADAARILKSASPEAWRSPGLRAAGDAFLADYDLKAKMPKLTSLIARTRGVAQRRGPPPGADDAAKRDLGEGVVELTFS